MAVGIGATVNVMLDVVVFASSLFAHLGVRFKRAVGRDDGVDETVLGFAVKVAETPLVVNVPLEYTASDGQMGSEGWVVAKH